MSIEIKKSIKPVKYDLAINYLEYRVKEIISKKSEKELIWFLEHPSIFTGGSSFKKYDILDNSIKITKTSRGGKITWHGPGQLICYLVINLNRRKKDLRKFLNIIEKSIIDSLKEFEIISYSDKENIGIWTKFNNKDMKVGAIGIKVKKWITYHGFSINITNSISNYKKIVPCGIKNKGIINLKKINKQSYEKLPDKIIKNLCINLKS